MAHIIAAGVGGIGITKDEDLAQRMRSLVNHGIDLKSLPGGEHYDSSWLNRKFKFTNAGHSFRTTEIESAIATVQLERWHSIIDGRQRSADHYLRSLAPLNDKYLKLPMTRKESDHSWMVFPLIVMQEEKHGLMEHLIKHKVECRDMLPLVNQPYLRHVVHADDFPVAQMINHHGFYIGCHQDLAPYQVERACTIIYEYFEGQSYYGNSNTCTD
jgi:dTDP-4-amino-4,6-dideoxygalactose transaminase